VAKLTQALIIGGGIAGPVAAIALRRAGIDSTIYESYPSTADGVGGVLMIAPNGLQALGVIGLDEPVRSIGQPIQRMVMADGSGKAFGEFAGLPGLPASQVVWRSDLYRVLHDQAAADGIQTVFGKRLVGVEETPDGITARFADGSSASGDILIGADGIRSTVRSLIDPGAPSPAYVGLLGFGAYADVQVPAHPDAMYFAFGKRAFAGYWLSPDGGKTIWFSNLPFQQPLTAAEARQVPATEWLERLRAVYADDVPARDLAAHTSADQLFTFGGLEILPSVPHWYRGRMVLVGDSAHAPSPSSGQGASLAIESAIELARCLRDVPDLPAAFASYEQLRRPRVEKVAAYAAQTNRQKAAGPLASRLMSLLMPIAMRTFMRPEKMFGWMHRYRIDWDQTVRPVAAAAQPASWRGPARLEKPRPALASEPTSTARS
jgi:2-polyprenyl-6-methoxyphenol hydroxylase-like FAD-dependent oxidoreductase